MTMKADIIQTSSKLTGLAALFYVESTSDSRNLNGEACDGIYQILKGLSEELEGIAHEKSDREARLEECLEDLYTRVNARVENFDFEVASNVIRKVLDQ